MSSLVSANLYVRQQRAMHRTLSPDLGFSVFAAIEQVSAGKANEDGQGITQRNTHVSAGQTVALRSGGDTTLKGAVVRAQQVQADIDGNLNLQSLQDPPDLIARAKAPI